MIYVMPTRIIIQNYILNSNKEFEHTLSVWDKITYSYKFKCYLYDKEKKELIIPGGYNLETLRNFFPNEEFLDLREQKIPPRIVKGLSLNSNPKNDLQINSINFLIGNKYSKYQNQKMLSLNTGEGKTYCAINYIYRTSLFPIIFVDQDSLAKQWKESIIKFTNCEEKNIFILSGRDNFNKLNNMKNDEIEDIKFVIAIHRTISSILNSEDGKKTIQDFFTNLQFGVKIFDEAHIEFQNIISIDCLTDVPSIYLTATPERSNYNENRVYQNVFGGIVRFNSNSINKNAIEKYHNVIITKVNSQPNALTQTKMVTNRGFSVNNFFNYVTKDKKDFYFETIKNILDIALKNGKRKTAIILHTIESVTIFLEMLKKIYPDLNISRFDGTVKKSDRNKVLTNSDIIVTTDVSFNKGIDVPDLEIVINLVPLSSRPKTEQMLGRLRKLENKEVFYFDVVDVGFDSCLKQLNMKNYVFKKKAKVIKIWQN